MFGDADIDVVVTWVDGSDCAHLARRQRTLKQQAFSIHSIPGGRSETRFADNGELELCLTAIRKFCPWVRRIFLVTDRQRPAFLTPQVAHSLGVCLIDHAALFCGYEWALPTFNSQSIESMIWRIDGLSERFIYFNDDVIVLRHLEPENFFSFNGLVLRGDWAPLPHFGAFRRLLSAGLNHYYDKILGKPRSMALLAQYRGAKLGGARSRLLVAPHVPHPMRRSTLESFFVANPDVLANNIRFPFRDMRQFAPIVLANHLELGTQGVSISDMKDHMTICFNRDSVEEILQKIEKVEQSDIAFVCLQGLENALEWHRRRIISNVCTRVYAEPKGSVSS